jgi:TolA-binding protein
MHRTILLSATFGLILVIVLGTSASAQTDAASGTNTEAEQHFEKANELLKGMDYEAAIAEYKKVINLASKSRIAQDAQYWIGQSHFEAGQFDAALSA